MQMLQVRDGRIVEAGGAEVRLRGTCIGGWMNMENFIAGYPGTEHGLRDVMAEALGCAKAHFFFERLLDYFLAEDDLAFLKEAGVNLVRLPLNYRHFESDLQPFVYLEDGFRRLDRALSWCEKHGIHAVLDLHSVQGWQNTDWHCDNSSRHTFFWRNRQFQERFLGLWREFARRYRGNPVVAGYNVMNEPLTNAPRGRFTADYVPDWRMMNAVYREVVEAIRAIDEEHLIFLEGDYFSQLFSGLEEPFAPNLVYSSHNYNKAGFGPGTYPGRSGGEYWDRGRQAEIFLNSEGTRFTRKNNTPLWVGEFGSVYNGPAGERPDRLRALDDQISVFEEHGAHWTAWTYKDVGVMGWLTLDPACEYLQRLAHVQHAKMGLETDFWAGWLPVGGIGRMVEEMAARAEELIASPRIAARDFTIYLRQAALDGFMGHLLQPVYAECFKGLSETELDRILASFARRNCRANQGLLEVVGKYL